MKNRIALLLLVLAVSACKKEVTNNIDQDKIFTRYELSYNENTDVTTATAEFRFSNLLGTRLELSDPSTVTVNSQNMEWSNENGNYTAQFSGFTPSATFIWVDLDGNSFSNTANIVDIEYPTDLPAYSKEDSVNYFMWAGAALDSLESVSIEFVDDQSARRKFGPVNTVGATTIVIDSLTLSELDTGLITTILVKSYSPDLVEGTSKGGLLIGKYRPSDRTFNLQ